MARAHHITEAQRASVLELHEQGLGRNAIARELGIGGSSVSRIIRAAGLEFSETKTLKGVAIKAANNRERRVTLAAQLLDKATQALHEMDQPYLAYAFGGRDNVYTEHLLDRPSTAAQRDLIHIASTALGRHMDLERFDEGAKAAKVRSMLGELGRALGIQPPEEPADG